ncbi:MAG: cytochrome family protein [Alphaproteobacteria bacterium]|nr:cytochrome family protein [Alphaproteobacteria bacterium]
MIGKHILWALVAAGVALAGGELLAQDPKTAQGVAPPYRQSFGDLMTMAIQPRHVKLGLAGQQRNWAYAAYELRELQGAFRRLGQAVPVYHSTDMTALIEATTAAPIDDVAGAIKSADAAKFTEAYAALTATCNACHQSTDHAAVVIQVPHASSFPDQDFSPQRP